MNFDTIIEKSMFMFFKFDIVLHVYVLKSTVVMFIYRFVIT